MQFWASLRSQHQIGHVQKVLKEVEQGCVSHGAQKEPSYLVHIFHATHFPDISLLACDVRVLDLLDNAPSKFLNGLLLISNN